MLSAVVSSAGDLGICERPEACEYSYAIANNHMKQLIKTVLGKVKR